MGLPVDEYRIVEAETELGIRLSTALRQRLMRNNGGEAYSDGAVWHLHSIWDPTDRTAAKRSASHIVAETGAARAWPGFPSSAISIAEDGSGDRIILRPGMSQLELWLHETGEVMSIELELYPDSEERRLTNG